VHPFVWALGLQLWSVSEAVRRNFNFWRFLKKFYIRLPISDLVFLKMYFMLNGLISFRKGDFAPKYVFRVVFEDGFLGGMRNFWGNPYLNRFDMQHLHLTASTAL